MEIENERPRKQHKERHKITVFNFDSITKEVVLIERMKLMPMTRDEAKVFMKRKLTGRRDCCFKFGGGE